MIAQVTLFQTTTLPTYLYKDENPWGFQRQRTATFLLEIKPAQTIDWEDAAEEAFHISNAPESLLSEEQQAIEREVRPHLTHSLSTGDVVQVSHPHGTEFFLCRSVGWERADAVHLRVFFNNAIQVQPEL
jgi:hypothetical protein